MSQVIDPVETTPDLAAGVTLLESPERRTTALHRLALAHLREAGGAGVWLDARGNAATDLFLHEHAPTPDLAIARAFTAYQHYELVRALPGDLPDDLSLVVLPCVDALYADQDVPAWVGERYLESALAILDAVASSRDVPVLVSSVPDGPLVDAVRAVATSTITAERTALGHRFEADDFATTVYWADGFWQTTIPYWVELFGAVERAVPPAVAVDLGLLPGTA